MTQRKKIAGSSYFNSRPSARGDSSCTGRKLSGAYFNSRPSARGDDRLILRSGFSVLRISIHAPPRGATHCVSPFLTQPAYFNSRPSARGDARGRVYLPNGGNFNSRPSARGDLLNLPINPRQRISIHAPPRGATKPLSYPFPRKRISIHAPPRGAT